MNSENTFIYNPEFSDTILSFHHQMGV